MLRSIVVERPSRLVLVILITVALALALLQPRPALATPGRIREFVVPTANSHPGGVAFGSDGAVWFTELATSAIGRLQAGTITSYPLPQTGEPVAIVSGPDGALWFADYSGGRIGKITTTGQVTEFAIPLCNGCTDPGPWDITAGPDGALWFTELDAKRIGRITTAGVITQFDLSGPEGAPIGITNGPDGALWFTDSSGVGRITVNGTITQETNSGAGGAAITTGPDGNLWFPVGSSDLIDRLNPSTGRLSQFPTALNCNPQDIASGSGAVWFTCYFLDQIGKVTTDGHITAFPVPNHFHGNYPDTLEGITAGAGNVMWFTEEAANRIGRITTS